MTILRERSHFILWTLLFFFIASMTVGGLVGGANILNVLLGRKNTALYVGMIDGESITRQEFEYERQIQLNRTIQQGSVINEQSIINAGNSAWNTLVENQIKNKKIKEMGLTVYSDEVYDFLLQTPPPVFQTNITDAGFFADEDGKFNLLAYQEAIRTGNIPRELKNLLVLWENYLKDWLADRKLRSMYNSLASVSNQEVLDDYNKKNMEATIDFIYTNPNSLPDSTIAISDEELLEQYNTLKEEKYSTDETVSVDYVLFPNPEQNEDSLIYSIEKDSIMNQAFLLSDEAKFLSFSEAIETYGVSVDDTLKISLALTGNSGIPFTMGNSRRAVRFAFDNNNGTVSDPIEMKNGVAVFHILDKNPGSYSEFEDVKENIKRSMLRDLKKVQSQAMLSELIQNDSNWEEIAKSNEYVDYLANQTSTLTGTFTDIGRSSQLEGALLVLADGKISTLIETPSSYLFLKMNGKTEFNQDDFNEKSDGLRNSLLSTKKNRGYFEWLNSVKNEIEIDDWRHLIY